MDIYHIYCDLKPGNSDLTFVESVEAYFGYLKSQGLVEGWRITRAKLGFGLKGLGDWHIMLDVKDLAQLEAAFQRVASRRDPVEGFHFGVNSMVANPTFALTRDFPDANRHRGDEKF